MNAIVTVYRVPKGTFGQPLTLRTNPEGPGRRSFSTPPAKRERNTWSGMGSTSKNAKVPYARIVFERPKRNK